MVAKQLLPVPKNLRYLKTALTTTPRMRRHTWYPDCSQGWGTFGAIRGMGGWGALTEFSIRRLQS